MFPRPPDVLLTVVHLIPALYECAAHVAAGRVHDADRLFEFILGIVSLDDGPLTRLARILADGLARRRLGSTISRALIDPSSYLNHGVVRAARASFIRLLPFLKMAYVSINSVILEAMDNEQFVHIVDLSGSAADSWQWLKLMHAFRRRPQGPPADLRITVVHDDGEFLAEMSARLRREAEALDMAFSFHGVLGRLETLDFGNLHQILAIKSGYARAISCALQMHRLLPLDMNLPPEPIIPPQQQHPVPPLMTQFQLAVRALSPKVLVLMEREANCNVPDFTARFTEALHYYAALFDALQDTGGMREEERAQVEQIVLGQEIKDMLVRDVVTEPLHQWKARMENAGFGCVPLSYGPKKEADEVLKKCRLVRKYENRQHENCLLLYRGERPLYAVSAWRPWTQVSAFGGSQRQHMVVPLPGQEQVPLVHNFTV